MMKCQDGVKMVLGLDGLFLEISKVTWVTCQVKVDGNPKMDGLRSNQTVICVQEEGKL